MAATAATIPASLLPRLTVRPEVFGGKPSVRELRRAVAGVLRPMARGVTPAAIPADSPDLEADDLRAGIPPAPAALATERSMPASETAARAVHRAARALQTTLTVESQVGRRGLPALPVGGGLWRLSQDGCRRDQQHTRTLAALRQRGEACKSRHERGDRQPGDTMAALRQQGEALRNVGAGVRERGGGMCGMIARTRPAWAGKGPPTAP